MAKYKKVKMQKEQLINLIKNNFERNEEKYLKVLNSKEVVFNSKENYPFIFILAADIYWDNERQDYKFKKEDENGTLDDKEYRLEAAASLYEKNKNLLFLLVGGYNEDWHKWRTEVMRDKLFEEYKIPKNKLKELRCLHGNTCGNAKVIIEHAENCNEPLAVLTNFYHIPRIKALLEYMFEKRNKRNNRKSPKFKFIPAELVIRNEGNGIENFYRRKEMDKRIMSETRGLLDIKNKTYSCSWD